MTVGVDMYPIYEALEVLKVELQHYLEIKMNRMQGGDYVQLSPLIEDGNTAEMQTDTVGLTLVHVMEDGVNRPQLPLKPPMGSPKRYENPPLLLKLYVLLSANFSKYAEAIKHLSAVIGFFQSKSVFDYRNTPEMPEELGTLNLTLYSMNLDKQYNLWSSLGTAYKPSVVYELRTLKVDEKRVTSRGANVRSLELGHRSPP